MGALDFLRGVMSAVTPAKDTSTLGDRPKRKRKSSNSCMENLAFAAGYLTPDGIILYLTISEERKDRYGRSYYTVGLTKKLHHARLFGNKRRLYLMKKSLPTAINDRLGRMYIEGAFPVPVFARPVIPNYSTGVDKLRSYGGAEEDSPV